MSAATELNLIIFSMPAAPTGGHDFGSREWRARHDESGDRATLVERGPILLHGQRRDQQNEQGQDCEALCGVGYSSALEH